MTHPEVKNLSKNLPGSETNDFGLKLRLPAFKLPFAIASFLLRDNVRVILKKK